MSNTTLYSQNLPKIILLEDVYDPDVDFGSIENTSKIIPAVGSLLIDGAKVFVVRSVDDITHKTTYEPISIEESLNLKRVMEYGNMFYALFFAKAIITDYTGAKITLTRLSIDDKLTFYGDHITNYDIVRVTEEGKEIIVSKYYDSMMRPKGTTCAVTGTTDNKKCVPCYSYEEFKPGKQYVLRAFDSAGNLVARIQLVTVAASILTDLYSDDNPITSIGVTSNQIDSQGKIFLYKDQDRNELTIYIRLKYKDGSEVLVGVDNQFCFLYGKEEINTHIAGAQYPLTVKYFLAKDEASVVNDGVCDNRFITHTFAVTVKEFAYNELAKISIIPRYDKNRNFWRLDAVGYYKDRSLAPTLLSNATFEGWNGTYQNVKQHVTVSVEMPTATGTTETYTQEFYIEVRNPAQHPDNPFLLADTDDQTHVYGDDTVNEGFIAPRMWYGLYGSNFTGYYIPRGYYTQNAFYTSAKENFLKQFYYAINPPKADNETNIPVPTHFSVRSSSSATSTLLENPIAIEDFENFMDLRHTSAEQYANDCLIVEFWKKKATEDDYDILFGVPVYVSLGDNPTA